MVNTLRRSLPLSATKNPDGMCAAASEDSAKGIGAKKTREGNQNEKDPPAVSFYTSPRQEPHGHIVKLHTQQGQREKGTQQGKRRQGSWSFLEFGFSSSPIQSQPVPVQKLQVYLQPRGANTGN